MTKSIAAYPDNDIPIKKGVNYPPIINVPPATPPSGDSSFHDRQAGVLARGEESVIAKEAAEAEHTTGERHIEAVAANIVHQIGDALYEALPPDIAHKYFVAARQQTNDIAIDFAKKLITAEKAALLEQVEKRVIEEDKSSVMTLGADEIRNALRAIQRKTLAAMKEEVNNG